MALTEQKKKRVRLDTLLMARGTVKSRKAAQAYILSGSVLVDDKVIDKAGTKVSEACDLKFKKPVEAEFVGRGGRKLAGALKDFSIDVTGYVVLDAGASTGGFTDCVLKMGAKKVYAVDVGYGQLAHKLAIDDRVAVIDRTNIRNMEVDKLPEQVDLAVVDLSFISLKKVLNNIANFVKNGGRIIALIKPQFEAGRNKVGKGGIVKDPKEHERVLEGTKVFSQEIGLTVLGVIESCIFGTKGNKEFFIYLKKEA